MKKLLCLIFVFCLLSLTTNNNSKCLLFANMQNEGVYSFYVSGSVPEKEYYNVIDSGTGSIVSCKVKLAKQIKREMKNILGESLCFEEDYFDINKITCVYKAKLLKKESLTENLQIYYLHSSVLPKGIDINEGNVNMQVACNGNTTTIGVPLILGSY